MVSVLALLAGPISIDHERDFPIEDLPTGHRTYPMDYRDTLRLVDFTTRHEPFVEELHHGVRDPSVSPVLLLPFCMIFRAYGNNRTVLPREIAWRYPASRCPR